MLKKLAVEFFGTYLLVIAATGVIISQDVPFIGIAASPAVAVMIMILVLGHFSDVHLNPAVSLAFLILKKISLKTFIAYVGWQLLITGPIEGTGINPARWFGPAIAGGYWDNWTIYVIAPLLGGALGAFSFRALAVHK
jgi:aquaporin Z